MLQNLDIAAAAGQVALILGLPLFVLWLERHSKVVKAIGPVIICYALGLALANAPIWDGGRGIAIGVAQAAVALAIPLLLFSLDVVAWSRLARTTLISFGLCVGAVLVVTSAATLFFVDRVSDAPKIAGMMVGVYTGGTPNMAAIGAALGVEAETFVLLNAADLLVSIAYLAFLLSVAGRVFGWFLPPFEKVGSETSRSVPAATETRGMAAPRAIGLALALLIVGLAAGIGTLAPDSMQEAVAILGITTLAIGASFIRRVRRLTGTHDSGQFFLLVFCVAIGCTADFGELIASSPTVVAFMAVVFYGSITLHLIAAKLLRLDRDTVIITSTAAIFGPAFVAPVAKALGNREVILSGLTTGLLGYAIGNYLGVGLAWLLA